MSFSDSIQWRDSIFEGIIEEAGKDHLIMSDPNTGKWQMILLIYLFCLCWVFIAVQAFL